MMGVNRWELPPSCCSPCKRWPRGVGGGGGCSRFCRENWGLRCLRSMQGGVWSQAGARAPSLCTPAVAEGCQALVGSGI